MERNVKSLRRLSGNNGFTLLELLVVLLIIGLLAGYVGPKYFSQIGKSNTTAAKAQIDAFDKAIEQFRVDTGHFPTSTQGLASLYAQPAGEPNWQGPYIKKEIPNDPWGRPYVYKIPGDNGRDFDIMSLGRDGAAGGSGEDQDVVSWKN
jgi:general secretion pathway protein G